MAVSLHSIEAGLNVLNGSTGLSAQQCLNKLAGYSQDAGLTQEQAWNVWAGTTGLTSMQAANVKLGYGVNGLLTIQQCVELMAYGFSPTNVSGLSLWLRADKATFSDAGTTPATNNGLVYQWNDQSGNGNNAVQATSGNRPTLVNNVSNGKPALRFDGQRLMVTSSFLDSTYNVALTIFSVTIKPNDEIQVVTSNGNTNLYTGRTLNQVLFNTDPLTQVNQALNMSGQILGVESFRYNGATKHLSFRTATSTLVDNQSATGNLGLSGALTIGDLSTGGHVYGWNGDLHELLVYKGALTAAQTAQVQDYLLFRYFANSNQAQLIFDGDSMTQGVGAGVIGQGDYPSQTLALLGGSSNYLKYNSGVSSATVDDMIADSVTLIDPLYSSLRRANIVCLLAGTNNLYTGDSAATTYTRIQTYAAARRAAGFKVIISTILPRSNAATPGTFEADRQTVNTNIRTNWASFADGICDVGADATIGVAGAELNTTYYADKVHMTDKGYEIVAGLMATSINRIRAL